ncbi:hypothetical protein H0X48_04190 [Candidatus Dependentiae bacterium]|nr:hypothetical protein [Candidatus Dependentiae bacterium]
MLQEYQQLHQEANSNSTHETLSKAVDGGYTSLVKQLLAQLKPTQQQISALGNLAQNQLAQSKKAIYKQIGELLRDYNNALALIRATPPLPSDIATTIAGYAIHLQKDKP